MAVEKLGLPTASIVCEGFTHQGSAVAKSLGMPDLPMSAIPGHVDIKTVRELRKDVEAVLVDQVVKSLTVTVQPKEAELTPEPSPKGSVFTGTFEEVNKFFYENEWSDGLPVVPPTVEKIEEFLKYTERSPEEVIGVLLPDRREATVWNIAVNGVMTGCRPVYMPILIAMVAAMTDPAFGHENLGHTPGTEVLITINGPIIKFLGFNYEQGALRVGFQSNTCIGRFWRLYLRNVAGFLPHKTDKATFGGTWRVVLAENEDAVARIGWEPMSVDQGFKVGDNVVTVGACTSSVVVVSMFGAKPEELLDILAHYTVNIQESVLVANVMGPGVKPQLILSPCIAETIAKGGYSKDKVKEYLYEHTKIPAWRYERLLRWSNIEAKNSLCDLVKEGKLPWQYCESTGPNRLVPIVFSPHDFMITVSGDPLRTNCYICENNGFIGYPVSKKIELPTRWGELLKEAMEK